MSTAVKLMLGAAAGAIVGFLYNRLVVCRGGACLRRGEATASRRQACPIAGNPWVSTGWWALIGGLLASGLK